MNNFPMFSKITPDNGIHSSGNLIPSLYWRLMFCLEIPKYRFLVSLS